STLAHLSQASFDAVSERQPEVGRTLARFIIQRLITSQQQATRQDERRPRLVAVVPLDDSVDTTAFASRLQLALLRFGRSARINARVAAAALGEGTGIQSDGSAIRLEQYL